MIAPLVDLEEPKSPFEVTSIDITGPYPTTLRGNKYFLAFTNQLTKYAEAHYVNANHKNWDEFESFYLVT
jgi:hypothetical protein